MTKRRSGILLHPSSLPGPFGIGDLGPEAYKFLNILKQTGTAIWQILPLGPPGAGNSPYTSFSAFAGSELLISPEILAEEGFISKENLLDFHLLEMPDRIDFKAVMGNKRELILIAYDNFKKNKIKKVLSLKTLFQHKTEIQKEFKTAAKDFEYFIAREDIKFWLNDYAIYRSLKDVFHGKSWIEWPEDMKERALDYIEIWINENQEQVEFYRFAQYLFFRHWLLLKKKAGESGIILFGDIPIFVSLDSADAWVNRNIFQLTAAGKPRVVAGVPPDYFSSTGQLWGNPLYNWKALKEQNYKWWLERFRNLANLVDWVRIDHFRGFESYWEVPAEEKTAINGKWKKGPGIDFFNSMKKQLKQLKVVAEDLGVITPAVEKLRDEMSFPGMKILQFAFGGEPDNAYLPHNHLKNCVVYTGTHDNDTTSGWYKSSPDNLKKHVRDYLGMDGSHISHKLMRAAFSSVADTAIIPIQDLMELGSSHRLNTPATAQGNWQWRMKWQDLTEDNLNFLSQLNHLTGRKI